jgi:hypothetical protein
MTTTGRRVFRKDRLTRDQERKIRELALEHEVPRELLAIRFNTSRENIRRIVREK